jgi:carboxylesterase type B
MLDQVAALKWVKKNIAHFDGDPNRITIDGHSAGGCSAGLLMISPLTKGK